MASLVTAVVTTHRNPEMLRGALESLRNETYRNFECVIVEDGSELTEEWIEQLFPGARLVAGENLGVAGGRNLGLAAARGEYITFLDDDDVAMPWRIATFMEVIRETGADLCYGLTRRVVVESNASLAAVPIHPSSSGPVGFRDLLINMPHVNAVLVRIDALRQVGGFDVQVDHFDDWSAWLRLADRGARMVSIREIVAEWRLHDFGLSGKVSRAAAMKSRILSLFTHLVPELTSQNAAAMLLAQRAVEHTALLTYDDYVAVHDWAAEPAAVNV
jgi:glycosyltransferase involved in cell wall biosynthesis